MSEVTVATTHKDRVFKIVFHDKESLLSLYNALANTTYTDVSLLEVNTLEDAVYISMKNDLSFLLDGRMNLFEHQSTLNPNMPLRGLYYISDLYKQRYSGKMLYTSKLFKIPTPQFIVFYNGVEPIDDRIDLKLSDAYTYPTDTPDVEVIAHVFNINVGHNEALLEKCQKLSEYAEFNHRVRENISLGMSKQEAIGDAVDSCIKDNILREILRKERAKIMGCILAEFDEVEYAQMLREEGFEDGYEEGMKSAMKKLIEKTCKKLQKSKSLQVIADELEEDIATIEKICTVAKEFAPTYDTEQIYQKLVEEEKIDLQDRYKV